MPTTPHPAPRPRLPALLLVCILSITHSCGVGNAVAFMSPKANAGGSAPTSEFMSPKANAEASAPTSEGGGGVTIIRAITAEQPDIQGCYSVRRRVFVEEQRVPAEIEMDENDQNATHILALGDESVPVGAARIVYVDGGKVGKIGRVCVLSEHRKKGIGRQVVMFAVEQIQKDVGVNCGAIAKLGSQVHAVQFYKSMGFELTDGDEYMDGGGIPHRDMIMHLE